MGHNAGKVLMGMNRKDWKVSDNHVGVIAAGLIARVKTNGELSIAAADGSAIGISLGASLNQDGRSVVCRAGLAVPIQVTAAFTPVVGTQVHISDTTGKAIASGAGATGVNATYASVGYVGINEDGTETAANLVALIDFVGGL